MQPVTDALELLTAQHDDIDVLLTAIEQAPSPGRRSQLITDLADQVTIHLAVEQELFYPAVSTLVRNDVLAEHAEIKRVLADLLWREHDERGGHTLARLRDLLSAHATWQEGDLFERIVETRTTAELAQLGEEISGWIDGLVAAAA